MRLAVLLLAAASSATALQPSKSAASVRPPLRAQSARDAVVQESSVKYDHRKDLETLLRGGPSSAEEFTTLLKNVASVKERVRGSLNRVERQQLARLTLSNERTLDLSASSFSSRIWALGTLGCDMDDLLTAVPQSSPEQLQSLISSFAASSDSIDLQRLLAGLSKLGMSYRALPAAQKEQLYALLLAERQISPREVASLAFFLGGMVKTAAGSKRKETSKAVAAEGLSEEGEATLPPHVLQALLGRLEATLPQMTSQGVVSSLSGLENFGLTWATMSPGLCSGLEQQLMLMNQSPIYSPDESCSFLLSLVGLKATLPTLSIGVVQALLGSIERLLPRLRAKQVVNVVWALGKMNYQWVLEGGGKREEGEGEGEGVAALGVQTALVTKIISMQPALPSSPSTLSLSLFDLESLYVGLGLMNMPAHSLPEGALSGLLALTARSVPTMNIFGVCNVLFGLARIHGAGNYFEHSGSSSSSSSSSSSFNDGCSADVLLGVDLAQALLTRSSALLHTFLPEQLGTVLWALGSLGFTKDGKLVPPPVQDRLQAVMSRVLCKLPVRGAAYGLWGLAKMGFKWNDFERACCSLEGGAPGTRVVSLSLALGPFRCFLVLGCCSCCLCCLLTAS